MAQQAQFLDDEGNPQYLDDNGNIVKIPSAPARPKNDLGTGGMLKPFLHKAYDYGEKAYKTVMEPPEFVTRGARDIATDITTPTLEPGTGFANPIFRGFIGGATEGAASLLSPANLLTLGRGRLPTIASQAIGGAQGIHGLEQLREGNYLQGAADIGMGILGMSARMPERGVKTDVNRIMPEMERFRKSNVDIIAEGAGRKPIGPTLPPEFKAPVTDIAGEASIRPQFNPKGQTGMTGNIQSIAEGATKPRLIQDAEGNLINKGTGEVLNESTGLTPPTKAAPTFAGMQDAGNGVLYVQFDRNGAPVSADDIKAMFPNRNINVTEFGENMLSPHLKKFRIDVFDEQGRISSKAAKEMADEAGGTFHDWERPLKNMFGKEEPVSNMFGVPKDVTPSRLQKLFLDETGAVQIEAPSKDVKVRLTKTSPEIIQELGKKGYKPGGVDPDGVPFMIKDGNPIPLDELPLPEHEKASLTQEMFNLSRGLSASWDVSAPFRQGLGLIGTKAFWQGIPGMFRALGDKGAYDFLIADIKSHPYFKEDFTVDFSNGRWVKKRVPSLAEEAGLAITDLKGLTNREEALMSTWAEKVPGVRASNRAYSVYLNKLRADTFRSLIDEAKGMGLDPINNKQLAKEIADFVNTATGRGPLRTHLPTLSGTLKERSVERAAGLLTNTFFSPRLMASRVRMLNPATYIAANPFVRKQYMKSLLHTAGAWATIAGLAKAAGADVVLDPTNADFGKIKIGNTRLDPAGGYQQYLVLASRLISGKTTPSTSPNRTREFGKGYQAPTRFSVGEQFMANKLHPVLKFAYDLFDASEYKSVQMGDRIAQMYVPLVVQDIMELAKEDPKLLPLVIPTAMGMGTQTYEKGGKDNLFIPPSMDYTYKGGAFK